MRSSAFTSPPYFRHPPHYTSGKNKRTTLIDTSIHPSTMPKYMPRPQMTASTGMILRGPGKEFGRVLLLAIVDPSIHIFPPPPTSLVGAPLVSRRRGFDWLGAHESGEKWFEIFLWYPAGVASFPYIIWLECSLHTSSTSSVNETGLIGRIS